MRTEATSLRHLLISASAGSGKTYQLVRRYLHLLALGEEADAIEAMTFTRKAAGEFFGRILQRLAELAREPEQAQAFFDALQPAPDPSQDYRQLLRRVIQRMHRLRLGTMDSFFAGIATCFSIELGLPAGARVMDETEAEQARQETLERFLERLYHEEAQNGQRLLMEVYKQATFGAEEKSVERTLSDWLNKGLSFWEDSLDDAGEWRGWGDLKRGGAHTWQKSSLTDAIADVRLHFQPPHDAGIDLLEETLDEILKTEPGMSVPKRTKEFLDKAQATWSDLLSGDAEWTWSRRKIRIQGEAAKAVIQLVGVLLTRELLVRSERTRGLASLLRMLADEYTACVRARGLLTFSDVPRMLLRRPDAWAAEGDDLWFRLDGRQQHWLLDEFQDTSRLQWRILSRLVDEVIQDNSGQRSFFAVGDPKQSIYLWREAEPDLFDDVQRAYPANDSGGLHLEGLSQSYRSAQPVLDAVNTAFGDTRRLRELLPEGALQGFAFQPHQAARTHLTGCAMMLSPRAPTEHEEKISPAAVIAALLEEIQPLQRGLSCAVLVRGNNEALEITESLRAATGMEIVCETESYPCTDNAVTLTLLSLLTLAAHPGDTQALEHLRMTPLWPVIDAPAGHHWDTLNHVQKQVSEQGFAAFVEHWLPQIHAVQPELDDFHQRRLAQLADIAAEFDATGNRDFDAFIQFARNYPMRQRGVERAIQVMTIHAAKGLEFDTVFLPSLDGKAMDFVRPDLLQIGRDASGINWVLQAPPRCYAQLDPALNAELKEAQRRATFESLCRLYVAMTRAKRGLYLIATSPPKSAAALKESKFLREMLGAAPGQETAAAGLARIEWQTGDPSWYVPASTVAVTEPTPPPPPSQPLGDLLRRTQPMHRRRTPSGEESFVVTGKALFDAGRDAGRRLGSLVHALLAEVEWQTELEPLQRVWMEKERITAEDLDTLEGPTAEALAMVTSVLSAPSCRPAFTPFSSRSQVWRERSFDLVIDGEWISGTFDRVLLDYDEAGRCTRAWIVDFKTDRAEDSETLQAKLEGYRPQLSLYRQAVQRLTGLPESAIETSLLLTRQARLVSI